MPFSLFSGRNIANVPPHVTASKKPHVSFFNNFYWSLVTLQYGVSTVQQSESATYIHICPLFWISFPSRSPESTRVPWALRRFSLVLRVIHSISGVYTVYLKHSYTRASQVFPFPSKPTITNQIGSEEEGSSSLIWSEPPRKEDYSLKGSENDLLRSISAPFRGECTHSPLTHAHKRQQASCGL